MGRTKIRTDRSDKEAKTGLRFLSFALRAAVTAVICAAVFWGLQTLLQPKWGENTQGAHETTNAMGFYDEPAQSLDVMFFGSSPVFFGTSPMKMWEEHGFTSYVRGSANQFLNFTYYMMKDAFLHQSPKVVVLEINQLTRQFDAANDEWIARRALDYLPLGKEKFDAVMELDLSGTNQTRLSYLFPLFRYHDRWAELAYEDFDYFRWERHSFGKGQYIGASVYAAAFPKDFMSPSEERFELPEVSVKDFEHILELCRDHDAELVLLRMPAHGWTYDRHNSVQDLADAHGLTFIDYNLPELRKEIGFNANRDFSYNEYHLRVSGAEKVSRHLGQFLSETYELENRRASAAAEDESDNAKIEATASENEKSDNAQLVAQWNADLERYTAYKESRGVYDQDLQVPELHRLTYEGGIKVSWDEVEHAQEYIVYRKINYQKQDGTDGWDNLGRVSGTFYIDTDVERGNIYSYTVKAVSGAVISECKIKGVSAKLQ